MKSLVLTATIAASIAFGAIGAKANEPDPTDDGNIIVECVGAPTIVGGPAPGEASYAASVPRHPLGPMSCGPKQHGRLF